MKFITLFGMFLGSEMANAQSFEASVGTAVVGTSDVDLEYLSHASVVPASGIDIGFKVTNSLNVLAGFSAGTVGSTVFSDGGTDHAVIYEDEDYYYSDEEEAFEIASTVRQAQMGVRYRLDLTPRFTVTATGQALLAHANLHMDEDIEMEGSEAAVKYTDLAPGGRLAVGLEWAPIKVGETRINVGMEGGYSHLLAFQFNETDASKNPISVGKIQINGQFLRWYIGTRF